MSTPQPRTMPGQSRPGSLELDDYTYSTPPVSIAAGQTISSSIQIEADSSFEILKRMAYFIINGVATSSVMLATQIPYVTVQLTDTGSGRNLFNTPVLLSNGFGNAQFPFIMQQTKVFSARSVIAVTLSNLGAVDIDALQLAFSGRKIFPSKQY